MDSPTPAQLGRADWILEFIEGHPVHIPCCTVTLWSAQVPPRRCGNGPLTGDQIETGNCGEHADITMVDFSATPKPEGAYRGVLGLPPRSSDVPGCCCNPLFRHHALNCPDRPGELQHKAPDRLPDNCPFCQKWLGPAVDRMDRVPLCDGNVDGPHHDGCTGCGACVICGRFILRRRQAPT